MRFLILLFAALAPMAIAAPSAAQDISQQTLIGYTETEKVGFAFYQLINKNPPYMDWITAREDYIRASPKERMDIIDRERPRLRDGFANYRLDQETILVKLPLSYTLIDNPDYPANPVAKGRGLIKRLIVRLPDDKAPYFPFQVGKFWVGVIPKGLENFLQIDLSEDAYKTFSEGLLIGANFKDRNMITSIILKPLQADAKTPVMEGDMPVFLLMADIASLSIRGISEELLWNYTAPWYLNSKAQDLMTLYK